MIILCQTVCFLQIFNVGYDRRQVFELQGEIFNELCNSIARVTDGIYEGIYMLILSFLISS